LLLRIYTFTIFDFPCVGSKHTRSHTLEVAWCNLLNN
jgi:hypothetical protein